VIAVLLGCHPPATTVVIRPLFVVTGASGSGKTTIFPELLSRMAGWCAVFDVDWLIDPLGRAAKDGQVDWPSFRETWLHIAHGVAQNGLPTLLLAPFIPGHLDGLPGRAWVSSVFSVGMHPVVISTDAAPVCSPTSAS
jgi:hypothetical protein